MLSKRNHSFITLLIVLAFFGVSVSCQMPFSLNGTETPSPVQVTPGPQAASCSLPNLVGMESQAAEAVLTALSLTLQSTEEFNPAPAGKVVSQQPAAGTRLNPCAGEVTIVVSQGPQVTPAQEAAPTAAAPISPPVKSTRTPLVGEQQFFIVNSIGSAHNGAAQPTTFAINQSWLVTRIVTYHWNGAKGKTPGTIALRASDGTLYGPWQASGEPGSGGVLDAYWVVNPDTTIPADTYTVIDSDPATWAQNQETGGRGMSWGSGVPQ